MAHYSFWSCDYQVHYEVIFDIFMFSCKNIMWWWLSSFMILTKNRPDKCVKCSSRRTCALSRVCLVDRVRLTPLSAISFVLSQKWTATGVTLCFQTFYQTDLFLAYSEYNRCINGIIKGLRRRSTSWPPW